MLVYANPYGLCLLPARSGLANHIVLEHQVIGVSANVDTGPGVVFDDILNQAIAMGCHAQGLITKEDAILLIQAYPVSLDQIV